MKKKIEKITDDNNFITISNKINSRVFARQLSRQLTIQELKKVSGGEAGFGCKGTNYPEADIICS